MTKYCVTNHRTGYFCEPAEVCSAQLNVSFNEIGLAVYAVFKVPILCAVQYIFQWRVYSVEYGRP